MIELAQLFQDVEAAVIQHEPAVEEIEHKAEATHENVGKATVEIDGAIAKARSRRRKQWWCLGIVSTFNPPGKRRSWYDEFLERTNSSLL